MSQRVMSGVYDWTAQETKNGLYVHGIAQRHPLLWDVQCRYCKSRWRESAVSVGYAPCRNVNCRLERERAEQLEAARSRYRFISEGDSDAAQRAADPDSLRRQLDYERGKRK